MASLGAEEVLKWAVAQEFAGRSCYLASVPPMTERGAVKWRQLLPVELVRMCKNIVNWTHETTGKAFLVKVLLLHFSIFLKFVFDLNVVDVNTN